MTPEQIADYVLAQARARGCTCALVIHVPDDAPLVGLVHVAVEHAQACYMLLRANRAWS